VAASTTDAVRLAEGGDRLLQPGTDQPGDHRRGDLGGQLAQVDDPGGDLVAAAAGQVGGALGDLVRSRGARRGTGSSAEQND
jgi:hypothetical protein